MAYSLIEGRFYYGSTDGDYFDFEGFVDDWTGGGSFIAGETINPGIQGLNTLSTQADIALSQSKQPRTSLAQYMITPLITMRNYLLLNILMPNLAEPLHL